MNRIKILDNDISGLIAAGEVVERPASVVKELIENSIDSGASKISVEIAGSGIEYIRVTDNGCGMSSYDAKIAFQKHATSKISSKDDLYSINTLGFRGEALAAISAVSKIKLITKEQDSIAGYYIDIEGGVILDEGEIGAADGTTIEVRDIFYNTPARLKFIKSEQTERSVISGLIEKLAISHTDISFSFIINGAQRFFTSGNGNLENTLYSVFGSELSSDMIPVDYSDSGIIINGFIGRPLATRPNRNLQMFFVNGRLIKSKILQQALELSYKNSMLVGRYPVCALLLRINSSEIDVNVHPSKLEIKFSNEKTVAEVVSSGVREALASESGLYQIKLDNKSIKQPYKHDTNELSFSTVKTIEEEKTVNNWKITTYKTESDYRDKNKEDHRVGNRINNQDSPSHYNNEKLLIQSNRHDAISRIKEYIDKNNLNVDPEKLIDNVKSVSNPNDKSEDSRANINHSQEIPLIGDNSPSYKLIGEVFNAYIILEFSEEIMFVDKHALHERMIFEKLRTSDFIEIQTLITPRLLSLSEADRSILLDNKENLKNIGFDIEDFGGTLIIREIPAIIAEDDIEVLLTEISNELKIKSYTGSDLLDRFLYSIACKAAIKSGKGSSEAEIKNLISDYLKKRDSLKYCPHGRPIVFLLSKNAIEKQFRRIVG